MTLEVGITHDHLNPATPEAPSNPIQAELGIEPAVKSVEPNADPQWSDWAERLIESPKSLPASVEDAIIAGGRPAVLELIRILTDLDLQMAKSVGGGDAPIVAAQLLAQIGDTEAIEPLLETFLDCGSADYLYGACIHALQQFGAAALEPTLARWSQAGESDHTAGLCEILVEVGRGDPRVTRRLLEYLKEEPDIAAGLLADLGDPRVLPQLVEAFDRLEMPKGQHFLSGQDFVEVREAIERLGACLTPEQEERYERAVRPQREATQRFREALMRLAASREAAPEPPRRRKGRSKRTRTIRDKAKKARRRRRLR